MCASASQSSSAPRGTVSCIAIWLAMEPDGANSAASCPNSVATRFCRSLTLGSSPNTSSPTGAAAIAARMPSVGLVIVSARRTTGPVAARSPTKHLRHEEGQLHRLLGVQPRVAGRLVPARQVRVLDRLRAAQALGHVLAGQLHVQAARVGAQRPV